MQTMENNHAHATDEANPSPGARREYNARACEWRNENFICKLLMHDITPSHYL
jgi:hypothetical protein